ncbi:phosphoribosylaminoimidazole carboxylase PurE [Desulfuromonas soudanensis]|uniref:N5-carboxyaminoimidazole ribonucleotide mutase n=1 Tax=Desulfuromonas soudanensis TaxID=1603606 RepID=A0A0M3QGB5_9BACT|nr:5-(carboxyamino)imidazole ribonucleotide mutase [Desulfuromonas soudanensis]ALC17689.1 phosphoribosylaminoimidazole carboxylase PurE [Desulfuromonas soudanensis]
MSEKKPQVGILMGSDNDFDIMAEAARALKEFGVSWEMTVTSAHRSPEKTAKYVRSARDRGLKVLIAGAGAAAHLAGVVAAETTLPVVAVPIDATALRGLDALLAMVQMPAGIPVATMAIGKAGARNAGLFAVQILSLGDAELAGKLAAFKTNLARGVEERDQALQTRVARELGA